jgi:hypothetical protein
MLAKPLIWTDFDGVEQRGIFYFNISPSELTEMEVSADGALTAKMQKMVETDDQIGMLAFTKQLISDAYGERSEDGQHFIKSEHISKHFLQSLAFEALFEELATVDNAAAEFMLGVMPKSFIDKLRNITPDATQTAELPEPDKKPWITENREPTGQEMRTMTREDLLEVFAQREERVKRERDAGSDN